MREAGQVPPAAVAQSWFSRMAGSGESGGDENQFSAGAARANDISFAVGGAGNQFVPGPDMVWPAPIAQMQAGS